MQYFWIIYAIFFDYFLLPYGLIHNIFVCLSQIECNMLLLAKEQKTYFEEHAEKFLKEKNITKAQLAKEMGVAPQNINKLFGTKNALTLSKIASYLNIPLQVLLFGNEEKERDIHGCIYVDRTAHLISNKQDLLDLVNEL